MTRTTSRAGAAIAAAALALCPPAPADAQPAVTRSITAAAGQITRVAVVPNLDRDCKPGDAGTIRVIAAPKNGTLIIRGGQLKTLPTYRCPDIEAGVQVLFYRPNDRYTGADEIVIETKLPDGSPRMATVRITVTARPGRSEKPLIDL